MKRLVLRLRAVVDVILLPFLYPAAWLLKFVRKFGVHRLPACRNALLRVGVFPITDHYYEPQFDNRNPRLPFSTDRRLHAIEWNAEGQLAFLDRLAYSAEVAGLARKPSQPGKFYLDNGAFSTGDAEFLYQLIRLLKPRKMIEIGSGNSTLIARMAMERNCEEDPAYVCDHLCIEPYEAPWLETTGARIVRKRVEEIEIGFLASLGENDILFIDSSHVIRPEGDVVYEYLQILPALKSGVVVHIHDIFSPRNYPRVWLEDEVRLWNEQYLVEAFLSFNSEWKILGALNWIQHHHHERLKLVAPSLRPGDEPCSLYLQRV